MDKNGIVDMKGLSTFLEEKKNLEGKLNGLIESRKTKEKELSEGKTFLNQLFDHQVKLKESVQIAKLNSNEMALRAQSLEASIGALGAKITKYEENLKMAKQQNLKLIDRFEDETEEIRKLFYDAVSNYSMDQMTVQLKSCHIDVLNANSNEECLSNKKLEVLKKVAHETEGTKDVLETEMPLDARNELLNNLNDECLLSKTKKREVSEESTKLKEQFKN